MRPLVVLLLLAACAPRRVAAPPRPSPVVAPVVTPVVAPVVAPRDAPPALACRFEASGLRFTAPLTLLHELPPAGAMAEYPFATVYRARRVQAEAFVGEASAVPVRVSLDTSMVHLEGVAHAAELALYPARPLRFGGMVTPLATHRLAWTASSPGTLAVFPAPLRRAVLRAPAERLPCDAVRLAPGPAFAPDDLPPPAARRRLPLGPGRWNLYPAPDARDGASAAIDLVAGDAVWLLEEGPARWARVLWTTSDAAIVGWVDRRTHVRPMIGHGEGTGSGLRVGATCVPASTVTEELPLLARDRGTMRVVGRLLPGAVVSLGAPTPEGTPVGVCDPDVEWADGVPLFIPDEGAGRRGAAMSSLEP